MINTFKASAFNCADGSEPTERTNIMGVLLVESLRINLRSRGGGVTNLGPKFRSMKFLKKIVLYFTLYFYLTL